MLWPAEPGQPAGLANRRNDLTQWLVWFAEIALEAQRRSIAQAELIVARTKLLDRLSGRDHNRDAANASDLLPPSDAQTYPAQLRSAN